MADRAAADEDLDETAEHYPTGPGRRRRTPGPNVAAYADGAIDRPCPEDVCSAQPLSFCRNADGTLRKLPHLRR